MDRPVLFAYQIYLIVLFSIIHSAQGLGKIIFAVNAGGDSHVDIYGIKYQKGKPSVKFLFTKRRRIPFYSKRLPLQIRWKERQE